jgi:hypothetical protein
MINDLWVFFALANHEQNTHHQPNLVPKESSAFNDTFVNSQLRALGVLLYKLGSEVKDATHIGRVLIVLVLEHALVLLTEISKVV